ncbi:hydroxy-delta-5-steroid dehydrogenase, 3 beta- and steroid delta-isomerase 1 [Hypanus sabinus]|uniref:hydroxy-delta-5-steroid dehydrogenase, 3 beta- and steroid delta-isomerase 1 n=1 Tax=Hypanus sabinus TaxID=79690 RepID=UPI0028C40FFA|nr:hydroxy-delta-5-steroid dehydrogenase, 3 beta- and steroid delta-isomerase 1 [Hypanus sabinus]XP_059824398.1 hydroxy-delta-5-steroid dehydrogenase, 3 beta- and steroid delta-isomerase 1 [Hypanus sabinus]XP_059824399.1 hydroxy-delta-5-steroid dehydrogenase, 3 beta- and steroid delta-isomerase 1 [Hypanus sabinus]XP_059824400.1 hydroxy-delta-5-steroid dehydrogenase, 3 beta- and steroid delta-isomerase 1 [Hypanus sabinus]XP_059824402.1 hydroxy-delta-5-steroid dehydrogenase, 3 beta- and steroid d
MSVSGDVYLVTGGNGFLGKVIIELLIEKAHDISEIRLFDKVIHEDNVERLQALVGSRIKLTVFKEDLRNTKALQKICQGVTCVLHTASLIDVWGNISKEELEAVNVEGSCHLLEACIQQNVKSFIYTSSIEVVGPNERGDPICNGDEDTNYNSSLKFLYSKAKYRAEQIILKANGSRLPNGEWIVTSALRPMYIYGENSRFILQDLDEGIANGMVLLRKSSKEALVNPVYVGNVAWAHILLARAMKEEDKRKIIGGKFYYITDDTPHTSYSDFNYELMSFLGFTIPSNFRIPLLLTYYVAYIAEMLTFLFRPFIRYVPKESRQLITMLNTKFTFISHKARNDFDYTPLYSWEVAKERTTAWLASVVQERRDFLNKK